MLIYTVEYYRVHVVEAHTYLVGAAVEVNRGPARSGPDTGNE